MSVTVMSDVGGHSMTLDVNGAKLQMDMVTAEKAAMAILTTLDKLFADQVAAHQQDALYRKMNHDSF